MAKLFVLMAEAQRNEATPIHGVLHTNANVEKILLNGNKAEGILLENGTEIKSDFVVCACDTNYTFRILLPNRYMPKQLKKQYEEREKYPVSSGFQIAYAVEGKFSELTGTRIFQCDEIDVGNHSVKAMNIQSYDYEPDFAAEGNMIVQSNFIQSENDYMYWEELYSNKELYELKKKEIAQQAMKRIVVEYPFLEEKIHILDVWTRIITSIFSTLCEILIKTKPRGKEEFYKIIIDYSVYNCYNAYRPHGQ